MSVPVELNSGSVWKRYDSVVHGTKGVLENKCVTVGTVEAIVFLLRVF